MTIARRHFILAPALLAGLLAMAVLRQPSDNASAYSGGSAIYAAQVVTPTRATHGKNDPVSPQHLSALLAPAPRRAAPLLPMPTGYALQGRPTVSASLIDQVLNAYGSPMAGDGKALYDLGVKYGIDPAYCLAFFVHESAAGTRGEAVLTHNLGNIRAVAGAPSMDGYRYYDTWLEGAADWYRLISKIYVHDWKLTTVDSVVPVYAPSADNNDPTAYIDDVEQLVSAWRAQSGMATPQ